jgi:hypothetical protein
MQVMKRRDRKLSAALALSALPAPAGRAVLAQRPADQTIGASNGQIVGVAVGIAGAGAAIGIGVYYAVKHKPTLMGCTRSGQDGLQLTSDSDKQVTSWSARSRESSLATVSESRVRRLSRNPPPRPNSWWRRSPKDLGPCEVASASR